MVNVTIYHMLNQNLTRIFVLLKLHFSLVRQTHIATHYMNEIEYITMTYFIYPLFLLFLNNLLGPAVCDDHIEDVLLLESHTLSLDVIPLRLHLQSVTCTSVLTTVSQQSRTAFMTLLRGICFVSQQLCSVMIDTVDLYNIFPYTIQTLNF